MLDDGILLHQTGASLAQRNYYYRVMRMLLVNAIPNEKMLPDELKESFKQCLQRMQTLLQLISADDFDYETFLRAVDLFVDEVLVLKMPLTPGLDLKKKQAEVCQRVKDYVDASVVFPATRASFCKSGMHAIATAFTRAASDLGTLERVRVYIDRNKYFEIENLFTVSQRKFRFHTPDRPPKDNQLIELYIGSFENNVDTDAPDSKFNDINAWVRHQLTLRKEKEAASEQTNPLILIIDSTMSVMDDTYLSWLLTEFEDAIEQGALAVIDARSLNKNFSMGTDKTPLGLTCCYAKQEAFPALTHLSEEEEKTGLLAGMQPDSPTIALATSIMQHEHGLIAEKIDLAKARVRVIQSEVIDTSLSNKNKMIFVESHLNKASYDHDELGGILSHPWPFVSFRINSLGLGKSKKTISDPIFTGMARLFDIAGISYRDGFGFSETVMTRIMSERDLSIIFRISLGTESEAYHREVFSIVNTSLLAINELLDVSQDRRVALFNKKAYEASKRPTELKEAYLDETKAKLAEVFLIANQAMQKIQQRKPLRDYPEAQRLACISEKDCRGNTVLCFAMKQPEQLRYILESLPEKQRLVLIREKNENGRTILDKILEKPDALQAILDALPESMHLDVLLTPLASGKTLLHQYAEKPDTLKLVLSQLPKHQYYQAISAKDKDGSVVLSYAAKHVDAFNMLTKVLPKEQLLSILHEENNNGLNTLYLTILMHPLESLEQILSFYSDAEYLAMLKKINITGSTILHFALGFPDELEMMLEKLDDNASRMEALMVENKEGLSVLQAAKNNPDALEIILNALPESKRLALLLEPLPSGAILLHCLAANLDTFSVVLDALPEDQYYQAISAKDTNGNVVLSYVGNDADGLERLAKVLPKEQLLSILHEENNNGLNTVYLTIGLHPLESLEQMLSFYSEAEYLAMLKKRNIEGSTILHFALKHPEALEMMLEKLEDDASRMEALMVKNEEDLSVIQAAEEHPDALEIILNVLPSTASELGFFKLTKEEPSDLKSGAEPAKDAEDKPSNTGNSASS